MLVKLWTQNNYTKYLLIFFGESLIFLFFGHMRLYFSKFCLTSYNWMIVDSRHSHHSIGMNSRATQLKFWCPRMSHYASHYHYGSQSIAFSGQWEYWTGCSQPVNCINLHKHRTPHCTAEWTYCLFPILCSHQSALN